MEVVNDLRHDPRPVDRIYRHQFAPLEERLVGKALLDHLLAVVEVAFDRQVVDVVTLDGGHLPPLHLRHPVMRMEDEDIHMVAALAALNGR